MKSRDEAARATRGDSAAILFVWSRGYWLRLLSIAMCASSAVLMTSSESVDLLHSGHKAALNGLNGGPYLNGDASEESMTRKNLENMRIMPELDLHCLYILSDQLLYDSSARSNIATFVSWCCVEFARHQQ